MREPVYVLGGYQTDFAKVWSRQGQDISDITREATLGALAEEGGYDPAAPPPGRVLAGSRSEAIRALLEGLEGSEEVAVKEGPVVAALAGCVAGGLLWRWRRQRLLQWQKAAGAGSSQPGSGRGRQQMALYVVRLASRGTCMLLWGADADSR